MQRYEKSATKADIQLMIDWLGDQVGSFNPKDPHVCVLAQYLKSSNPTKYVDAGMSTVTVGHNNFVVPFEIIYIAYNNKVYSDLPQSETFVSAHQRALKVLKNWIE